MTGMRRLRPPQSRLARHLLLCIVETPGESAAITAGLCNLRRSSRFSTLWMGRQARKLQKGRALSSEPETPVLLAYTSFAEQGETPAAEHQGQHHSKRGRCSTSPSGMASVGPPALTQAFRPPWITLVRQFSCSSMCATRTLVASRAHEQYR